MDVDGLCLSVTLPAAHPEPSRQERSDRLRWLLTDNPELPAGLSSFDRAPLVLAVQLALADLRGPDPGAALAGLSDGDLIHRVADALEHVNAIRARDGLQPPNDPAVLDWLPDAAVLRAIRAAALATGAPTRDGAWQQWLRARFAATVGAIFVDALATACPEIDSSHLAVDIEPASRPGPATAEVWLTETAPGGTGQIEHLHAAMLPGTQVRSPGFSKLQPCRGTSRNSTANCAASWRWPPQTARPREAAGQLRESWQAGHAEVSAALAGLRAAVAADGFELSRLAWTAVEQQAARRRRPPRAAHRP